MFVITGIKGEDFVVTDTDDNVRELWSPESLIDLSNRGISIQGVYENRIVCIASKGAKFLSSLEVGSPFKYTYSDKEKSYSKTETAVYMGYDANKCVFLYTFDGEMICAFSSRYLKDNACHFSFSSTDCNPTDVTRILRGVKKNGL